jgi:hypothetical protein
VSVPRRAVAAGVALVLALLALMPVARWERDEAAVDQNRGIASVRSMVGPTLGGSNLSGYRPIDDLSCLLYRRGRNPSAFELCFDSGGRLVEAVDRRGTDIVIWSLRHDRELARHGADPKRVQALVKRARTDPPGA